MSAINTQCPPESMLSDFGLGKLDATQAETVGQHLETCADCRQRVASLSGDSFVNRLRGVSDGAAAPDRIEHTFVGGDSASNAAHSSETPWGKRPESRRAGIPRPSPTVDDKSKRDGPGGPSSAPPELANHPDYELIKELGQGGMGVVYLAKNRMMDRLEVLKVVSKALLDKPGALERFQQEIRSAAKLLHPNIVAAHSVLRPGDLLVFAMEYVPGQDLMQVVKKRGHLPIANAAFYAHQVAQGLQHAHEAGMVHRDIKPNNLMLAIVGKKHIVKILDFGLAKATSEKAAETALTKSGQMLGTPDYIAPEQTLDAHKADIRADIYSLGCTLYYLLAGRPPFQEGSLYALLEAHQRRDPQPLNLVRPDVPIELAAVVGKMLAKDPAKRYQTPIEVARALTPFFKPSQAPAAATLPPAVDVIQQPASETIHAAASATEESIAVHPMPVMPLPVTAGAMPVSLAPIPLQNASPEAGISIDTRRDSGRRIGWWRSRPPWQQYAMTGGAAALLLFGIVLLVQTPHGTVEITISDPKATVTLTVDKNKIDIGDLDEPLSLEVGEHDLKVTGNGYETVTKKFTITKGKNSPLSVELVRQEAMPNQSAPPEAKTVPPAEALAAELPPAALLGSTPLEHNTKASCCQFSPDGKLLATGGQDGVVKIWDAHTGKKLHELVIRETVQDVTFRPDSKILLTWTGGSPRGNSAKWKPRFWDSATAKELTDFPISRPIAGPLAFSPDGSTIAVAAADQSIDIYDSAGKPLVSLAGQRGAISCLAFSPDSTLLASGSDAREIKLWKIADRSEVLSLEDDQKSSYVPIVHTVLFSRDGRFLVVGINANTLVYDRTASRTLWKKRTNTWQALSLAISRDNKYVVAAGGQGDGDHFVVADALTGGTIRKVRAWKSYGDGYRGAEAIALSPDGRTLASAGPDHTIKIWDAETWEERPAGIATPPSAPAAATTHHEREVAEWVISSGGKVRVEGVNVEITDAAKLPARSITLKAIVLGNAVDADLVRVQDLPNLTDLVFSRSLGDVAVAQLKNLPNLNHLGLARTNVSSAGLRHVPQFRRLKHLHLYDSNVGDDGLTYLEGLPLQSLTLWGTRVTGKGLRYLKHLPLRGLFLNALPIHDADLAELNEMRALWWLDVDNTQITDAGLELLKPIMTLTRVWARKTNCTQQGADALRAALPKCDIQIEGSGPNSIPIGELLAERDAEDHEREVAAWVLSQGGRLRIEGIDSEIFNAAELPSGPIKIKEIDLNRTEVTDPGLGRLHDLPSLIRLSVDARAITDAGLAHLKNLPNLRGLSVAYTKVTGAGMQYVKQFKRLTELYLYGSQVGDDGMRDIRNLRLECLSLNGTRVTGDGLRQLKDLPLRSLSLAGIAIGDDDMVLLQGMRTLHAIELQETQVGDAGLEHLKTLTQLTTLSLMKTKVSPAGVKALHAALPKCEIQWP